MVNRGNWEAEKVKIDGVVGGYFGLNLDTKSRSPKVCFPRQIRAYCLYIFTDLTLKEIANRVGLTDHTTIIHTVKVVRGLCKVDEEIKKQIIEIESMIE